MLYGSLALAQESRTDTRPGIAPDIREDDTKLKLQRGDFVIVPIPISNQTLGTGLVAGAAYFYAQTDAQKKLQPASVTAATGVRFMVLAAKRINPRLDFARSTDSNAIHLSVGEAF